MKIRLDSCFEYFFTRSFLNLNSTYAMVKTNNQLLSELYNSHNGKDQVVFNILKHIIIGAQLLVFINLSHSQTSGTNELTLEQFKKSLNKRFAALASGGTNSSVGNFASFDPKGAVKFAGNMVTDEGILFGLNVAGSVNDGLLAVFENSTFSKTTSIEFQCQLMSRVRNNAFIYYDDSFRTYNRKIREIESKYELKLAEVDAGLPTFSISSKIRKLTLDTIKIAVEKAALQISNPNYYWKLDSLNSQLKYKRLEIVHLNNDLMAIPSPRVEHVLVDNERIREQQAVILDIELFELRLPWWSFYYKVSNNAFKQFDPTKEFDSQISDKNFTSHEVRVQYNYYQWSMSDAVQTFYINGGVTYKYLDNFDDLSKKEITEVKQYGANVKDRSVTKKYDAYQGKYNNKLNQVKFYGEYYHFLLKANSAAFHLYADAIFRQKSMPRYNIGGGFLYSFTNKEKDKPVVNAELFYNVVDITNGAQSDVPLAQRNILGLRFAFPINFKIK